VKMDIHVNLVPKSRMRASYLQSLMRIQGVLLTHSDSSFTHYVLKNQKGLNKRGYRRCF
jgi:hypothetical protein